MALPRGIFQPSTCPLQVTDTTVVEFEYLPIPGARWSALREEHIDTDGTLAVDDVVIPLLTESVQRVRTVTEGTPPADWQDFTADDAEEFWGTWPEWCRRDLYAALYAATVGGPSIDPFVVSKRIENAGRSNPVTRGRRA